MNVGDRVEVLAGGFAELRGVVTCTTGPERASVFVRLDGDSYDMQFREANLTGVAIPPPEKQQFTSATTEVALL